MSSNSVPIQEISDTVGHKSTHVTETGGHHNALIRPGRPPNGTTCLATMSPTTTCWVA